MKRFLSIAFVALLVGALPVAAHAAKSSPSGDAITRRIQDTLPEDLQVGEVGLPPNVTIPADATVSVTWKIPPRPGNSWVHLAFGRDGQPLDEAYARVKIVRVRHVLVASRPLRAGDRLQPGDVTRQAHTEPGLEMGIDALVGSEILRNVAAGKPLRSDAITMPAPLPRGTAIRVIVRAQGLLITASAVLEQPALPGEQALVRIESTRQLVRGQLIDGETVIINRGAP